MQTYITYCKCNSIRAVFAAELDVDICLPFTIILYIFFRFHNPKSSQKKNYHKVYLQEFMHLYQYIFKHKPQNLFTTVRAQSPVNKLTLSRLYALRLHCTVNIIIKFPYNNVPKTSLHFQKSANTDVGNNLHLIWLI